MRGSVMIMYRVLGCAIANFGEAPRIPTIFAINDCPLFQQLGETNRAFDRVCQRELNVTLLAIDQ